MYPEPHIPSAPGERAVDGEFKLSDLSKRTLFVLSGGALLLFISLSLSVMRQANLRAECDPLDETDECIVIGKPPRMRE